MTLIFMYFIVRSLYKRDEINLYRHYLFIYLFIYANNYMMVVRKYLYLLEFFLNSHRYQRSRNVNEIFIVLTLWGQVIIMENVDTVL